MAEIARKTMNEVFQKKLDAVQDVLAKKIKEEIRRKFDKRNNKQITCFEIFAEN